MILADSNMSLPGPADTHLVTSPPHVEVYGLHGRPVSVHLHKVIGSVLLIVLNPSIG